MKFISFFFFTCLFFNIYSHDDICTISFKEDDNISDIIQRYPYQIYQRLQNNSDCHKINNPGYRSGDFTIISFSVGQSAPRGGGFITGIGQCVKYKSTPRCSYIPFLKTKHKTINIKYQLEYLRPWLKDPMNCSYELTIFNDQNQIQICYTKIIKRDCDDISKIKKLSTNSKSIYSSYSGKDILDFFNLSLVPKQCLRLP